MIPASRLRFLVRVLLGLSFAGVLAAQAPPADPWAPLKFLLGTWSGKGSGKPGEAISGSCSFAFELGDTLLVLLNACLGARGSKQDLFSSTAGCSISGGTQDKKDVPGLTGPLQANGGPTATNAPPRTRLRRGRNESQPDSRTGCSRNR